MGARPLKHGLPVQARSPSVDMLVAPMSRLHSTLLLLVALLATGCLAPPPRIVVETPYGDVRADSQGTAVKVAVMLEELSPQVQALLPGSQVRAIDVWVQDELRVYRFNRRPESVRGFTLLSEEFHARRIHLQEDGQSSWYLSHELVHALIGESWSTLPGILEEGLADVVAQELTREQRAHIRAHRLLNATAFTGGLELELGFRIPERARREREREHTAPEETEDAGEHAQPRRGSEPDIRRRLLLRLTDEVPIETARKLLETGRGELHERWPEIPEAYYGFAWLVVARIHERVGIDGLHELCLRAAAEGHELVPAEWLLAAADMDLENFDARFVANCFTRSEFQRALLLRPEAFAEAALTGLEPLRGRVDARELFYLARPAFLLGDRGRVQLSTVGPVSEEIQARWAGRSDVVHRADGTH